VLVVGGAVVAAMRRSPPIGRFARDLRRGARFEPTDLPPAYARAALDAARVLELEICAVDMLDVKGVPRVFEVNSSPSIKEAETACGVDAAGRRRAGRGARRGGAARGDAASTWCPRAQPPRGRAHG
jgi:ribosomal protein S6--L-glutamate ligase